MNIQRTLLRREIWEHKGGFVWAPLAAAALFIVIVLGGMIAGSAFSPGSKPDTIVVGGQSFSGSRLGDVLSSLPSHDVAKLGEAVNLSLWIAAGWPFLVLAFVAFVYCVATLYDERKDRSVLFWKSMPVSDRATVLSKALTVLVVAPAIAASIGATSMLIFFCIMSVWASFQGVGAVEMLWGASSPLSVIGLLFGALPIYALWALPTAGWLMLCSALARSKPFLWALLIPILAGAMMSALSIGPNGWFWHHVVQRVLLGFFPGSWLGHAGPIDMPFSLASTYASLSSPSLWVGALAGIGMLLLAANVRRWKDEG